MFELCIYGVKELDANIKGLRGEKAYKSERNRKMELLEKE